MNLPRLGVLHLVMPHGRHETALAERLLEDLFGLTISRVGGVCLREKLSLGGIVTRLQQNTPFGGKSLTLKQVRRALCVMEQHSLVEFRIELGGGGSSKIIYSTMIDSVLDLVMYPRACLIAKKLFTTTAEAICEELSAQGRLCFSETIRRVKTRLDVPYSDVKQKFSWLAEAQFIARVPPLEGQFKLRGCPVFSDNYNKYVLPDDIMKMPTGEFEASAPAKPNGFSIEEDIKPDVSQLNLTSRKRKHASSNSPEAKTESDPDANILWRINIPRFRRYVRDEIVLDMVCGVGSADTMDSSHQQQVNSMRALLKVAEVRVPSLYAVTTPAITLMDVLRSAKDAGLDVEKRDLEWSLGQLVDDSRGILRRAGDSGGGLFLLDFERAISLAADMHVESLLREQVDSKAVRIRRLLQARKYLEEDAIEKAVMLPSKQTRELLYSMLEENYVAVKCFGKTNDFAAARTISLFHVDPARTARSVVESTCQMLHNLIVRRQHEAKDKKTLVENEIKTEAIIAKIEADEALDEESKEQQKSEVEQLYMAGAKRKELDLFQKGQALLHAAEIEAERVLFTLQMYLHFSSRNAP